MPIANAFQDGGAPRAARVRPEEHGALPALGLPGVQPPTVFFPLGFDGGLPAARWQRGAAVGAGLPCLPGRLGT